jgi:3-oxoadipate enol-lactonase
LVTLETCSVERAQTVVTEVDVSGGGRLYVEEGGVGPPVVLLHAGLLDRQMWDREFQLLRPNRRAIRYDLRGHGDSSDASEPYSPLADLTSVMDALDVEQADLIGLCSGGRVAAEFARVHPARVRRLVVSSSPLGLRLWSDEVIRLDRTAAEAARRGDVDSLVKIHLSLWLVGLNRDAVAVPLDLQARVGEMMRRSLERSARGDRAKAVWPDPPAADRLSEIEPPLLFIVGALDLIEIRNVAADAAAAAHDGRLCEISNAGHLVNLEQPAEFLRAAQAFIETAS